MRDGWIEAALGDVIDIKWGDTSVTKRSYVPRGYLAYSAAGPDGFLPYFDYDQIGFVTSAIGAQCGKTWLAKGQWSCIKNTIRAIGKPDSIANVEFVFWALSDPARWPRRGSAQPFISQTDARAMKILLPTLPEQRRIAGVLGALDDLIDTNQRLSANIESLLSGMFAQLRFDAPPAGDHATRLSQIVKVNPATPIPLGPVSFVDMASLGTSNARISGYTERPSASSVRFANGDALMARITPCLENGKAAYVDLLPDGAVASGSTEFIVLRARGNVPPSWPYFLIRSERFRAYATRHMTGTSGRQRCPASSVASYPIVAPTPAALRAFGDAANPLMETLTDLAVESEGLRTTRDELLPILMSGAVSPGELTVVS